MHGRNNIKMIKHIYWSSCEVPIILFQILMKIKFSRHIFKKYPNIKVHENPSGANRVVPCGQKGGRTDGHDEANSRF